MLFSLSNAYQADLDAKEDIEREKHNKEARKRKGISHCETFKRRHFWWEFSRDKPAEWKHNFGYATPEMILKLFYAIRNFFPTKKDSDVMKLNKIVFWCAHWHAKPMPKQIMRRLWSGGEGINNMKKYSATTLDNYLMHVSIAIDRAFPDEKIFCFPSEAEKLRMIEILKLRRAPLPNALFAVDNKCTRTLGKTRKENLCWKFKFRPGFNNMFVRDRVLGFFCYIDVGHPGSRNDVRIFKESALFSKLGEAIGPTAVMLADAAFVLNNTIVQKYVLAIPSKRKHPQLYAQAKESFWDKAKQSRNFIEQDFGILFVSQWPGIESWNGHGEQSEKPYKQHLTSICKADNFFRRYKWEHDGTVLSH